jgi:hypothetical protein
LIFEREAFERIAFERKAFKRAAFEPFNAMHLTPKT